MNNFFLKFLEEIAKIENTALFAVSIIPYSIFLYYLYKVKTINNFIKTGFSLTILFVFITIVLSIISLNFYDKTLVEVDIIHGSAEFFLTLSDFIILIGFIRMLKHIEVKNS
tara:strand:- start:113 stop:448 length:336 start_codon:yes stop_codon:yes gene_type:complete